VLNLSLLLPPSYSSSPSSSYWKTLVLCLSSSIERHSSRSLPSSRCIQLDVVSELYTLSGSICCCAGIALSGLDVVGEDFGGELEDLVLYFAVLGSFISFCLF